MRGSYCSPRTASAWLVAACFATAAVAQEAGNLQLIESSPGQRDKVLPVQTPGFLKDDAGDTFVLPDIKAQPVAPASTGSEGFELQRVEFRNNTVVPTADLQALAHPYIGKRVTVADIEFLRQQLTRLYIDRGYINSGVLLVQATPAAPGVLVFEAVEGKLQDIRIQGAGWLRDSYIRKRLEGSEDEALNMETLRERYQLLLNDPMIARMNARLLPGTSPGQAILDVDVTRHRPWQLSVFADNYRSPTIGSLERGVSGSVQNLTGFGDLLEASVTESPHEKSSTRGSVGWRMPLNAWGTDLTLLYEEGQSTVTEDPLAELAIDSLYETREAGLSQVLYESLQHRVSIGVSQAERETETFLLGEPFSFIPFEDSGKSESTIRRFWQEYTWRSNTQVLALRSTFSETDTNLQDPDVALPTTLEPDKTYDMWTGQLAYVRKVMENGAQVSLRGTLQDSDAGLLPTDDFVLGGVSTIRGYRENQFVFDKGHMINLEFHYPLLSAGRNGLSLTLKPFVDYGKGTSNLDDEQTTLSSAGIALDAAFYGVTANIAIAKRLTHPDAVDELDDDWQDKGVHFKVAYNF